MSGRFLLDTNAVIALFSSETSVKEHLAKAEEVFVSSIVLGELYYGAFKSDRTDKLKRIDDFAAACAVLCCDRDTAKEYGSIKSRLLEKGTPIPENDIWISAIARQHGLVLVTSDKHFEEVEDLKLEVW
ncbi:MAG: type II toxin-antitoxin system VapC family toxin [Candidatus Methanoperedens sp.]|nr:type II toxin-antitoxin system VapC family toxin [Candidatus Methanoperedens sp.]